MTDLLKTMLMAVVTGLFLSASVTAEEMTPEQFRKARQTAAHRQRRIIFNNDGNEPVYLCQDTTPEELLRHRTSALAGTQVDTIFYCTWSSGFGLFTHDTKVGHVFTSKEDLFSKNITDKMLAAGTDPLKVMVDFGRKNGIEIFWSFRMNDTHDAGLSGYGPVMFRANPLKLAHPEWLIGTPQQRPKYGGWSAVDFTHPEIRDLAVKLVEEVAQNYDIDGIELDFFRHPVFFKQAAQSGAPCSDEERALMTDTLQRMRTVMDTAGQKRGRPILLAVRVPDSIEFSKKIGLDLPEWLGKGLVDVLITSGYFQLNPWETSVAIGKKYHVPVYPSLDESRVRDEDARKLRMSVPSYRGRALEARQAGTDGVYLFNAFNPNNPIWKELGSVELLEKQDQDYFASIRGVGAAAGGTLPHQPDQHIPTLNPHAPLVVKPDAPVIVTFPFACNLEQAHPGVTPKLTLHLQFDHADAHGLTVTLNGKSLSAPATNKNWLEFRLTPDQLTLGNNSVEVSAGEGHAPVKLLDLRCSLRWPKAAAE